MSKKTAVEWLQERLLLSLPNELKSLNGFFVIAKEMEKEQIIQAYNDGKFAIINIEKNKSLEQYYNETYKKEEK
jgi:Leu/Phe-tRNA-protein transferase